MRQFLPICRMMNMGPFEARFKSSFYSLEVTLQVSSPFSIGTVSGGINIGPFVQIPFCMISLIQLGRVQSTTMSNSSH